MDGVINGTGRVRWGSLPRTARPTADGIPYELRLTQGGHLAHLHTTAKTRAVLDVAASGRRLIWTDDRESGSPCPSTNQCSPSSAITSTETGCPATTAPAGAQTTTDGGVSGGNCWAKPTPNPRDAAPPLPRAAAAPSRPPGSF